MDLVSRIAAAIPALCRSEVRVAQLCIKNPHKFASLKISDIAKLAHTSSTTVIRFCNHIGYTGFLDLKFKVLNDSCLTVSNLQDFVEPQDSVGQVLIKSIDNAMAVMTSFSNLILAEPIERAATEIAKARKQHGIIQIYGFGGSSSVAFDMQYKFMLLGFTAQAYSDEHLQAVASCLICQKDVAIFVSKSGQTLSLIELAKGLNERGIKTIAISPKRSALSQACCMQLPSHYSHAANNSEFDDQLTQFLMVDILATTVALKLQGRNTRSIQLQQVQALAAKRLFL